MKKLNLDDTWKYCMRMWRWIAERKKAGDKRNVNELKEVWLKNHNISKIDIDSECFFCEYTVQRQSACSLCPARKVDKNFHCNNCGYKWRSQPVKFYNQLRKLNKLRKLGRKL